MLDHSNIANLLDAGTTDEPEPRHADFPVGSSTAADITRSVGWKAGVTGRPWLG